MTIQTSITPATAANHAGFLATIATLRFCAMPIVLALGITGTSSAETPHLKQQGTATQLIVDGEPFLIRGGELGNSAATTLESMKPIWPQMVKLNLNTVLVPAYWDLIEPKERQFDFALIDGIIEGARKHNLRIVFLWFGSWKNSMSCYAPEWVKANQERFPRSIGKDGRGIEILSAFDEANATADAYAFAAFMKHLRDVDGDRNTVIMVQVENEIGMIPEARDWSEAATDLYQQAVPPRLMEYLVAHKEELMPEFREKWDAAGGKTEGTWEAVFGPGLATEEIFMAWHFARYTNRVAAKGKEQYPLPMFVNAALVRPNYKPGQYPSAGPLPHLIDVWRAGAPQIDFLSPDIYFPNFVEWCRKYDRGGNPLFIPEALRGSRAAAYAFYVAGEHDAMGLSPFAIDSNDGSSGEPLARSYALLKQLTPIIVEHQGQGTMRGIAPDVPFAGEPLPTQQVIELGGYKFTATFERPPQPVNLPGLEPGESLTGGLIIQEGPDEFLIAGTGLVVTFAPDSPDEKAGIASIRDGKFVDGGWVTTRRLGGDESHQGRHLRIPAGQFGIQRVKLYRYR